MLWIPFTLLAALMQAIRNALQKQLSHDVSIAGVTFARFVWALPLAFCYCLGLNLIQPQALPAMQVIFLILIVAIALAQILGTLLMVRLFTLRNYAIGAGLAKSEAIIAAILGVLLFSESLSILGWLGVSLGAIAVLLLSGASIRFFSWPVLLIGLSCGLSFALNSLWVRQASLLLPLPALHSAAWVLLLVMLVQFSVLLLYIMQREPQTLQQLWARPRLIWAISCSSFLGSVGWFTAFSLASVAMVKTLGQVEVLFMLMISVGLFKEKLQKRAISGLVLIVLAALAVIWA